jgi:hypothetical protein
MCQNRPVATLKGSGTKIMHYLILIPEIVDVFELPLHYFARRILNITIKTSQLGTLFISSTDQYEGFANSKEDSLISWSMRQKFLFPTSTDSAGRQGACV